MTFAATVSTSSTVTHEVVAAESASDVQQPRNPVFLLSGLLPQVYQIRV